MEPVSAIAHARAGLLGNPSDGYGGKAIALSLRNFRARVQLDPADGFRLCPGPGDALGFPSLREAAGRFARDGCEDGLRLLRAAIRCFEAHTGVVAAADPEDPRLRFAVSYETDVPRQVGLAGSSAIVVAALDALCRWFERPIPPAERAELALRAEREELGIAAGAMDRVIQCYGGLVAMDLAEPRSADSYRRLDPALLPPLFVAWDPRGGESSGRAHGGLRARFEAGDPEVLATIDALRALVDEGVEALEARDAGRLHGLLARNFALRARIFPISARDREMVALASERGAAARLCGSGGAVIGMAAGGDDPGELGPLYREAGFRFLRPEVAEARAA